MITNVSFKQFLKSSLFTTRSFLQAPAYFARLKSLSINPDSLLILATLPRSGTHLLQQLLANSFHLRYSESRVNTLLSLDKVTETFPNNWHISYFNYHKFPFQETSNLKFNKPSNILSSSFFDDVTRSHSIYQKPLFIRSPLIHLRRNPLDYFISLFNYKYKKRGRETNLIQTPFDVYLRYRYYYLRMYHSYKSATLVSDQRIRIYNYEDLISDTASVLFSISLYLGLDLNQDQCAFVADHCSIKSVLSQEKLGYTVNPTANRLTGSFTNSGKIGQWKESFSDSQINHIFDFLTSNNFVTSDFRYE